ncbi:ubiquitin-like-conjugating enzyme ATG10 [Micractinium conductrix]|uniref:Ubiquitin-like-conjugating enzyme ATG10 n=1 Tax=Micractinium conductrix TaxID=554055 RepID=A0A2P6VCU1_9CHLO|nr:ubiquitin-like-conjugating enzyme ATG10 [Micractinium conductrix]|eukprot:PSC71902.1 ubiquitin-like-conjugating enzyme ATG10 [Micractinium conductrix]
MLLTPEDFAAGAAALEQAWAAALPSEPAWRWVPVSQPFAAAAGGGYLATEQQLEGPAAAAAGEAPGAAQAAAGGGGGAGTAPAAAADSSEDVLEVLPGSDEEGTDPADARQRQFAGEQAGAGEAAAPQCVAVPPAPAQQVLWLACHIVYHLSYRVPVLFFEASDQGGAPLGLAALLAALPRLCAAAGSAQPGTVVTQEEHPLLRRPFFMLHPCQTPAVMALLLEPEARPDEASSRRVCCSGAATESPAAAAAAAAAARAAGRAAATVVAAPGVDGSLPHAHPVPPGAAAAPASGAALRYLLAWLSVAGQPLGVAPPAELWMQRG